MQFSFKKFLKREYIILFLILIIGAVLRLPGIFSDSFAFTYDVGRDMLALESIASGIKIPLIGPTTGIPGVFYGPWWYYMLTPFFIIFKGNPQGIALTISAVGLICIFLSFYFGKKIGNNFLGLSMAFLTAISPSLISSSVQIWNPNIAPLLVLLSFILLERIFSLKNKASVRYFFILGLILSLNADIEVIWGILFLLGVTISLFLILKKTLHLKQIIYYIFGILFVLGPRIVFELRHSFIMTKSFMAFFSSKNLEDKLDLYHFLENRVNVHLDTFGKSFMPENYLNLILFLSILIVIIVFFKNSSKIIKSFVLTSFTIVSVFYIGTLIFGRAIWPHYLVGLPILYILLFSLSLYMVSLKIGNNLLWGLTLLAMFILNFNSLSIIKNTYWEGNASVYRNQLNVVDYVYKEAEGKDFKFVVYTPPVFDFTYRYLFSWYGKKQYNYLPTEQTKDATYSFFIIEPDPGYEDRPKWWIEARKNDGKIIKEEKLKGGIIVQTRVH